MTKQSRTIFMKWILGASLAAISFQAQATIFHVLSGEICTAPPKECKGSSNECYPGGKTFNLPNHRTVVPKKDSEIGFQNRLGQTKYIKLKRCSVVDLGQYDAAREKPETLLQIVKKLITGEKKAAQGGKRLKPGASSLASMPQGDILLPTKGIILELNDISPNQILRLKVTDSASGNTLIDLSRPNQPIVLSASDLRSGRSHSWTIHTPDKIYQGMFLVLEPKDQEEVESEVQAVLESGQAGPMGQLMMRAAVYHDYGLIFNRNQILKKVKTMQEGG